MVTELLLADGARCVNLVAKDEEGHLGQLLDRQKRVKLRLRLGEALVVSGVDKEDDAVNLGEVVTPEAASYDDNLETIRRPIS